MTIPSETLTKDFSGLFDEKTHAATKGKFNTWFAAQFAFISTRPVVGEPLTKPGFYNGRSVLPGPMVGGFPGKTGIDVVFKDRVRLFDERIDGEGNNVYKADWEAMTKVEYNDYLQKIGQASAQSGNTGVRIPLAA